MEIKHSIDVCTRPADWKYSIESAVIPFSIHSAFHEGEIGEAKVKSLLNHIKSRAKMKPCILFCEGAHLNALALKYGDVNAAMDICREDTKKLRQRFNNIFSVFDINLWDEAIFRHDEYNKFKIEVTQLYNQDDNFRNCLEIDAKKMYSEKISIEYPDKDLFIYNTQLDIMEMIVACQIMSREGYKINIYPGARLASAKYLQSIHYLDMLFVTAHIKIKG